MPSTAKRRLAACLQRWPPLLWMLRIAGRVLAPRQYVGAVGAVFNDSGQLLLVEHVFRTDFPWGLPGGWVEDGEDPSETVKREVAEELKLEIEVKALLLTRRIPVLRKSAHPPHLGLAYYCRLVTGEPTSTMDVLSVDWCDATKIARDLAPRQRLAAELGLQAFQRERRAEDEGRVRTS